MGEEQNPGVCPKHEIPYTKSGWNEKIWCFKCHTENLENYFKEDNSKKVEKTDNIISSKTYSVPVRMRRIYAIMEWLTANEGLLEATEAVQITIHVKKQKDTTDSIQGTILHLVKSK